MHWRTTVKPDVTWHTCRFSAGPVEFELTVRDAERYASWSVSIMMRPHKYVIRGNREIGQREAKRAAEAWLQRFLSEVAKNAGDPMIAPPSAWKTDSDRTPE